VESTLHKLFFSPSCWWGFLVGRGRLFAVNNQNCCSVVPFCSRTTQHLIAIVMCKSGATLGLGGIAHPP
jgi:hypothetical protein